MGNSWSVLHASKCPLVTAVDHDQATFSRKANSNILTHNFSTINSFKSKQTNVILLLLLLVLPIVVVVVLILLVLLLLCVIM